MASPIFSYFQIKFLTKCSFCRLPSCFRSLWRHTREADGFYGCSNHFHYFFLSLWCCPDDDAAVSDSFQVGWLSDRNYRIVFRAFQGIGGAGLFTLTLSVATEIPGKARTIVQIMIPCAFGISAGAAPLIGGAIVSTTTWRWVFLLK